MKDLFECLIVAGLLASSIILSFSKAAVELRLGFLFKVNLKTFALRFRSEVFMFSLRVANLSTVLCVRSFDPKANLRSFYGILCELDSKKFETTGFRKLCAESSTLICKSSY